MAKRDWLREGVVSLGEAEQNVRAGRRSCLTVGITQGRASYTMLKGVSAARRNRLKPAEVTTSRIPFSPDCAPRHNPTSCEREHGVHNSVEKE